MLSNGFFKIEIGQLAAEISLFSFARPSWQAASTSPKPGITKKMKNGR
jgi:hypothetical protein